MFKQLKAIGLLAVGSVLLAGCTPETNDTAVSLKLYTFDCGTIVVSDLDSFSSSGDYAGIQDTLTNTCYLVRHPQGDLVWDLGLPLAMVGAGPQTNDVFTLTLERSLADQLADIDLSTDDIELISISHSHFDHSGQAALFSNSQWLVNQNELDHMFASPESSAQNAAFADLSKIIISGDHDIFGDGSVTILDLPGHTPGHTALQVNLAQAGPILLTGDLYHRTLSREQKHVPRFNTDEPTTRLSMDRFEALAKASGARVIIQHEPKDIATLPVVPKFLQ